MTGVLTPRRLSRSQSLRSPHSYHRRCSVLDSLRSFAVPHDRQDLFLHVVSPGISDNASLLIFIGFLPRTVCCPSLSGLLRHKAPVSPWPSWFPSGGRQHPPQRSSSDLCRGNPIYCPRLRPDFLPSGAGSQVCNTAILSQGLGSSRITVFRFVLAQCSQEIWIARSEEIIVECGGRSASSNLRVRSSITRRWFHLPRFLRGFTGRRQGGAHPNIAATATVCSVPTHLSRISCTIGSKSRCCLTRLRSECGESSPIWAMACDCSCDHRCRRVGSSCHPQSLLGGGSRRASARRCQSLGC